MKKLKILVIFKTLQQAKWYLEDTISKTAPNLIKKDYHLYESDYFIIHLLNLNSMSIIGHRADYIFLTDECPIKDYKELILPCVKGDNNKIKIVC